MLNPVPSDPFAHLPAPLGPLDEIAETRMSPIHGLGLFAKVDIPAGTVWWSARPGTVLLISQAQYKSLSGSTRNPLSEQLLTALTTYCYYAASLDSLVLCLDNARFVNHSDNPNSGAAESAEALIAVALRDIKQGDEIFENYFHYDECPWMADPLWFEAYPPQQAGDS